MTIENVIDSLTHLTIKTLGNKKVSFSSVDLPVEVRMELVEALAAAEVRVCGGACERLQLAGVLAAFSKAKNKIAKLAE